MTLISSLGMNFLRGLKEPLPINPDNIPENSISSCTSSHELSLTNPPLPKCEPIITQNKKESTTKEDDCELTELDLLVYANIKWWANLNKMKKRGLVKGSDKHYTRQSIQEMTRLIKQKCPEATISKVRRSAEKLERLGYIESGFYSWKRYHKHTGRLDRLQDRTKCYTTTGKYEKIQAAKAAKNRLQKNDKCISGKERYHYKAPKKNSNFKEKPLQGAPLKFIERRGTGQLTAREKEKDLAERTRIAGENLWRAQNIPEYIKPGEESCPIKLAYAYATALSEQKRFFFYKLGPRYSLSQKEEAWQAYLKENEYLRAKRMGHGIDSMVGWARSYLKNDGWKMSKQEAAERKARKAEEKAALEEFTQRLAQECRSYLPPPNNPDEERKTTLDHSEEKPDPDLMERVSSGDITFERAQELQWCRDLLKEHQATHPAYMVESA